MGRAPITVRDVFRTIREQNIRFLDLKFVDLFGQLQHITAPVSAVSEDTFLLGQGFDGSSVRGFTRINESDMILRPDPASMFVDPFYDDPTISVFCNVIDPNGHKAFSRDPRGVARKAERLVQSLGIADTAFYGPEIEFFIFDSVDFDQSTQHGYYFIDSDAAFWRTGTADKKVTNLGHRAARKQAYFAAPPVDKHHNLRSKISNVLEQVGISPEFHHHEVAAAGQCEVGFRFGPLTEQADAAIKFKYVVKNVVARYGKTATFMPKPLLMENGSGMHVNLSLAKNGRNLFFSPGGYADLSPLALHFIAGVLEHASALCAFCSPTTNSYRRLVPGYEAPIHLVFSQRNRSACIRIPMMGASEKTKRIEFRTPDPTANPYLAFAAILLAGIDGVQRNLEPPQPVDENIYAYARRHPEKPLRDTPATLAEAIAALEKDHTFLTRDGVFSEELIDTWIEHKRKHEIDFVRLRPHPSEFALYFNT